MALFARQIRILTFAFFDFATTICKYKNNSHFVSLSAYRGNKITLFGKNKSQIVSATRQKMVQRQIPSSVKCIGVKKSQPYSTIILTSSSFLSKMAKMLDMRYPNESNNLASLAYVAGLKIMYMTASRQDPIEVQTLPVPGKFARMNTFVYLLFVR